jgi:hypothetical protein
MRRVFSSNPYRFGPETSQLLFADSLKEEHAAKAKVLGARWWTTKMKANLLRRSAEEIRPDGEFLDKN